VHRAAAAAAECSWARSNPWPHARWRRPHHDNEVASMPGADLSEELAHEVGVRLRRDLPVELSSERADRAVDVQELAFVTVADHRSLRLLRPAAANAHHLAEARLVLERQSDSTLADVAGFKAGWQHLWEFFSIPPAQRGTGRAVARRLKAQSSQHPERAPPPWSAAGWWCRFASPLVIGPAQTRHSTLGNSPNAASSAQPLKAKPQAVRSRRSAPKGCWPRHRQVLQLRQACSSSASGNEPVATASATLGAVASPSCCQGCSASAVPVAASSNSAIQAGWRQGAQGRRSRGSSAQYSKPAAPPSAPSHRAADRLERLSAEAPLEMIAADLEVVRRST